MQYTCVPMRALLPLARALSILGVLLAAVPAVAEEKDN